MLFFFIVLIFKFNFCCSELCCLFMQYKPGCHKYSQTYKQLPFLHVESYNKVVIRCWFWHSMLKFKNPGERNLSSSSNLVGYNCPYVNTHHEEISADFAFY